MEKLSTQTLNGIFDFFNQQPDIVLWILSRDYQRQLYLSPMFENIWGEKNEVLYNNPATWNEFLYEDDVLRVANHAKTRVSAPEKIDKDVLFYRAVSKDNEIKFLKGQ